MILTTLLAATAATAAPAPAPAPAPVPVVFQDSPGLDPALVGQAKEDILKVLVDGCTAFSAGDIPGAMAPYNEDVLLYDIAPPFRSNYAHLKEVNTALRGMMAEPPSCTYKDMQIALVTPDFAYAIYLLPYSAKLKSGQSLSVQGRGTDLFRKIDGKWKIVHEHFSLPSDPLTGKAELVPPAK